MNSILFLVAFCFLMVSCSKESQPAIADQLIGEWRWTAQYSGEGLTYHVTPLSTGIQETLIITSDNRWDLIQNGASIGAGTFKTSVSYSN